MERKSTRFRIAELCAERAIDWAIEQIAPNAVTISMRANLVKLTSLDILHAIHEVIDAENKENANVDC